MDYEYISGYRIFPHRNIGGNSIFHLSQLLRYFDRTLNGMRIISLTLGLDFYDD